MDGERHQPYAALRVEALDGFHQADVALLDQVAVRQSVTQVAASDGHDDAQVRQHQFARGLDVVLRAELARERDLMLGREDRKAVYCLDVCLQAPDRDGQFHGAAHISISPSSEQQV